MIIVALGSQKFQFNRLLKKVDDAILNGVIKDEVFAQIGVSDYQPRRYQTEPFISQDIFQKKIDQCSMVITHGGVGIITDALKKGKRVLAMPRLEKYNEHVDDHQIQILKPFEMANYICVCQEHDNFDEKYLETMRRDFSTFESNTERFICGIRSDIDNL